MKKNLLLFLTLLGATCLYAQEQLLNSGFQTWTNPCNPDYWATICSASDGSSAAQSLATQDFSQYTTGNCSIKLTNGSVNGNLMVATVQVDSLLNGNAYIGGNNVYQPFYQIPYALAFDYQYYSTESVPSLFEGPSISCAIWGSDGSQLASLTSDFTYANSTNNITGWHTDTIDFGGNQGQGYAPAEISLKFTASDGPFSAGTTLWVDNVRLIYKPACPSSFQANVSNPICNGDDGAITLSWANIQTPYFAYWTAQAPIDSTYGQQIQGSPYTISNLAPGTYTVRLTSPYSYCQVWETATITNPPVLVTSASATPTNGSHNTGSATATASGGEPPYSYQWSNSDNTAQISNLAAGTYFVTITDHLGCDQVNTVVVIDTTTPPAPVVITSAATNIQSTSVQLNGVVNADNTIDTAVSFEWGLTTGYGNTNAATPDAISGTTSTNVSTSLYGLLTHTTYYYHVVVTFAGHKYYGNQQQFTTGVTGIPETDLESVSIYPNPAKHQFTIDTHTGDTYTLELYNVLGQKTLSQVISQPVSHVDVSNMAGGIYTVTLKKDEAVKSYRLVIVNE